MKKLILIVLIIAGANFMGCSDGSDSSLSQGRITITDIPSEYNGKYAVFIAEYRNDNSRYAYGLDFYDGQHDIYSPIVNGICILPLWTVKYAIEPYTGNDNFYNFGIQDDYRDEGDISIKIYDHQNYRIGDENSFGIGGATFASVRFSKGNASLSWNDNKNTFDGNGWLTSGTNKW